MKRTVFQMNYLLVGAAAAFACAGIATAQTTPAGDPTVVKGTVAQYSLTPGGAIDGLILADGNEIRLPRHVSSQVAFAVHPGDSVTIRGFKVIAEPVLTVSAVTNDATGLVIDVRPPVPLVQITVESRVKLQLHNPDGHLDGVLLEDGTVVRMPPFEAEQLVAGLAIGSPLYVSGDGMSSPLGKVIAAREIGPNKANFKKLDSSRFERWMHEILGGRETPTVAVAPKTP
jgi:hypothetical protein